MLCGLPSELVRLILENLYRDVQTLRAVSLTCNTLLPVAREFLFAVVGSDAVREECVRPYLHCIVELRFRPVNSLVSSCRTPIHEILWQLDPQLFPRLTAITLLGLQFWDVVAMPPSAFRKLSQLPSVTELTLSGMSFLGLQHVQAFICALPQLETLKLHRITYGDPSLARRLAVPLMRQGVNLTLPPGLARLAFSPDMTTRATSEVAEWLGKSPTAATLETIIVPFSTRSPHYVVSRFGPSVRHLSMPVHGLDNMTDNGQFHGYTNLRTLTVFMDSYNMSPGSWYMLVPFLERGPPSRMIQKLTIDVRIEFPTDLSAVVDWAVLDRINDMLEDTKFDTLRDLEFVVQLKEELGWDPREEAKGLLARIEDRLYNMVGPEKRVVTRYWRVDEVRAHTVPGELQLLAFHHSKSGSQLILV
ncbi:hypothetical protein C8Q80DRAFT_1097379 [Daedaleopsis nitida]|nr:hypothetical protein C8Q80DRAFT_1097379 [Daedaleopsis nitida]